VHLVGSYFTDMCVCVCVCVCLFVYIKMWAGMATR
jgi:hypothetical protein